MKENHILPFTQQKRRPWSIEDEDEDEGKEPPKQPGCMRYRVKFSNTYV